MRIKSFVAVGLGLLLSASAFAGPSAKFAATWSKGIKLVSVADVNTDDGPPLAFDINTGYTLATIKVPQDKELLVGVSAEIGLVTDTSIKGQQGGAARALAGAGAAVVVFAVPTGAPLPVALAGADVAEPGLVVLSARVQVLDATLGGVIKSCDYIDGGGTIVVASDCVVEDEEIGLILATLASHHFNFVLPNMDQGEYDLVAFFVTGALAAVQDVTVSVGGSVTANAYAKAFVRKTMVTLQRVRAAEGGVIEADIVEL